MAKDWKTLKAEIEAEVKRIWMHEPEEHKKLRLGIVENQAGSYGQYFTTWEFAVGMIRDYPGYGLYPLLKLATTDQFDLAQVQAMFRAFDPPYTSYLGYSGFRTLERFGAEIIQSFDSMESKDDFIELLKPYILYLNKLNAWCFHYFPHGLGVLYPLQRAQEIVDTVE
jgi:hypothetical protein